MLKETLRRTETLQRPDGPALWTRASLRVHHHQEGAIQRRGVHQLRPPCRLFPITDLARVRTRIPIPITRHTVSRPHSRCKQDQPLFTKNQWIIAVYMQRSETPTTMKLTRTVMRRSGRMGAAQYPVSTRTSYERASQVEQSRPPLHCCWKVQPRTSLLHKSSPTILSHPRPQHLGHLSIKMSKGILSSE